MTSLFRIFDIMFLSGNSSSIFLNLKCKGIVATCQRYAKSIQDNE